MKQFYDTNDAFRLYQYYLAMRQHFSSNYDYFKYNGKVSASVASFNKRRDRFHFYKLSKRKDAKGLIFANVLKDHTKWIGDMLDEESEKIYKDWRKRQESLTYVFKSDLKQLNPDFNSNFIMKDGDLPPVIKLYFYEKITLETITILDMLIDYTGVWQKKNVDNILVCDISKVINDYKPFLSLSVDKQKYKRLVLDEFNTP